MKYVRECVQEMLRGARVLVRLDLNVPVHEGRVVDDFRISHSLPTLTLLREAGAKIIVIAHIGRESHETLAPVAAHLNTVFPVSFVEDIVGEKAHEAVRALHDGEAIMLENVRQHSGEHENDESFARALAQLGDVFVNDAFADCHRAHASITGIPKCIPGYAGLLLEHEYTHLSEALRPQSPSLAILGGAKFDTKEPLIIKLLGMYDRVLVAGALVNDVFKAKGWEVGRSVVSEKIPEHEVMQHPHLMIPTDVLVEREDKTTYVIDPQHVTPDGKIVDVGPATVNSLTPIIVNAQTVLWNGPTGLYEDGYDQYTDEIAALIGKSAARSYVGGADTIAAIGKQGITDQFTFLSTGGGAMLEFLLNGTLPGIEALKQ